MKLTPEACDRVMILTSYGYTQKTIAGMIGVSENTISYAKKTNQDLANALTVGKTIMNEDLKANLRRLAMEADTDAVKVTATSKALELAVDVTPEDDKSDDSELRLSIINELSGS